MVPVPASTRNPVRETLKNYATLVELDQRVLIEALHVSPRNVTGNVTGLVDGLEAGGFVVRAPHPTDRRATLVTLTERGRSIAAEMQTG